MLDVESVIVRAIFSFPSTRAFHVAVPLAWSVLKGTAVSWKTYATRQIVIIAVCPQVSIGDGITIRRVKLEVYVEQVVLGYPVVHEEIDEIEGRSVGQ